MNEERRSNILPCSHKFAYVDFIFGVKVIRCCACGWTKVKNEEEHRATDLTFEEYLRRKVEFNG